jgi:hypothetical protein
MGNDDDVFLSTSTDVAFLVMCVRTDVDLVCPVGGSQLVSTRFFSN